MMELKNFWCRYWVAENAAFDFDYVGPWWVTPVEEPVYDEELAAICFAIRAENPDVVEKWFRDKFDEGDVRQRVYIHEMDEDWIPFNEDYSRSDWMVWPYRYVSLDRLPGLMIGDTEIEVRNGELKISEAFIPAESFERDEFGVGDTVTFPDPTQGGLPVKCIVEEIAGAAVKLVPVDEDSVEWVQVVVSKDWISKYVEQ
jgi:hypothetical protein